MSDDYIELKNVKSHQRKEKIKSYANKVSSYISKKKEQFKEYSAKRSAQAEAQKKQDAFQRKLDAQAAREELKNLRQQERYKSEINALKEYKKKQSQARFDSIMGGFSTASTGNDAILGSALSNTSSAARPRSDPFGAIGFGSSRSRSPDPFASMFGAPARKPARRRAVHRKRRRR